MAIFSVAIKGLGAFINTPSGAYAYVPCKLRFPQVIFGLEKSSIIIQLEDFSKPKIVWNRIAAVKQFAIVDKEFLIQDSMHFIIGNNLDYICSILNSKIIQWLLSIIIGEAAGGNAGNADNIWNLPIPLANINVPVSDIQLYNKYCLSREEIDFIESQQSQ